jgi:murein L,D-transpeptidase YafK
LTQFKHFHTTHLFKIICVFLIGIGLYNPCQAQLFYGENTAPVKRPKKQKEVPRFPPQFRSRDTIGQAKRIADSLINIAKNKQYAGYKKYTEIPDTIIKIISSKEDVNGNITTEKEIIVGTKHYFQISKMAGKLNRPFSADTINKDSISIQIVKKTHRLYVYHKHRFLTSYKCVFGPDPFTQKQYEGDKRTPEGWFKIKEVRNHDEWVKFMLLDYPNEESYKIYMANKGKGLIPAGKNIGGAIGIHGVAPGCDYFLDQKREWTDGCIALTRPDIEELSKVIKAGTPVFIKLKNDGK